MSKNKNREQTTKNRLVEEYKDEVVLYLLLLDDLVLSILLSQLHIYLIQDLMYIEFLI